MSNRKWSVEEMARHGFEVGYYSGYYVDLKIPKCLSQDDHYAYAKQKLAYINGLSRVMKRKARKKQ